MEEIQKDIKRWFNAGSEVALAQVTKTWGSSPRTPGSLMAISNTGQIAGSVSGGCIEGSVIQSALDCLETACARVEKFHASTKRAQEVGLSCGGSIEVLVTKLDCALFEAECFLQQNDKSYARISIVQSTDPRRIGRCFLVIGADSAVVPTVRGLDSVCVPNSPAHTIVMSPEMIDGGVLAAATRVATGSLAEQTGHIVVDGDDYFFAREAPKPMLVCIGGVHIAIHLTRMAKALGYKTVVVDPRGIFSTEERFDSVDQIMHAWPQEAFKQLNINASTAVCALTHDPKIDVPALALALETQAFYIGSLGRMTTQLTRYRQLSERGVADECIARIYGPIGLDIGGREPSEIALSIMAEVIAVRRGSGCAMSSMLESARVAANPSCRIIATA